MKQAKRVFALVLVMVLMFSAVDWVGCMGVKAYAENTPTQGSTEVGSAPDELLSMGEWIYWVEDGQATVAGYADKGVGSLQIPARLGGYPVTGIGEQAFSDNTSLCSIQIPTNVTRIADDAFEGLTGLTISAYHGAYALVYAKEKRFNGEDAPLTGVVFAEGVLDLSGMPDGSYWDLSDYGVVFAKLEATFLSVGQIVYFPISNQNPTGLARRIDSITDIDDQLVVSFSEPEWGECFVSFSGEDEVFLDWDRAILEDGVSMEDVNDAGSVTFSRAKQLVFNFKFESKEEGSNRSAEINFTGTIQAKKEITVSWDIGVKGLRPDVKELSLKIKNTDTVSGKLLAKPCKLKAFSKRLASVPTGNAGPVSGWLDFYLLVQVSGEAEYKATVVTTQSITYKNGKVSNKSEKSLLDKSFNFKAELKIGPEFQFALEIGIAKIASIRFFEATLGFYIIATGSGAITHIRTGTETTHYCTDLSLAWDAEFEAKIGIVSIGGSAKFSAYGSVKYVLGPFNILNGHFDNGQFVGNNSNCWLKSRKIVFRVDNKDYLSTTGTVNYKLTEPQRPVKNGWLFEGWFVDTSASGLSGADYKYNFSNDVLPYCGNNGTFTLYAKFYRIAVADIKLNKSSETIYTNAGTIQLNAKVSPANATDSSVKWTSSNNNVAKVNSNGKVTPVAAGTATITCASKSNPNVKATFKITVKQYVEKVSLSANSDEIFEGETLQINANVSPSDSSNKSLSWSSSNTSIATVDANGKVSGVKCGTVTITATAKDRNTVSGQYTVNVLLPVTGIALDKSSAVIYTNNQSGLKLNAALTPAEASQASVSWSSSNTAVATVDKNGVVKPVAPGTAVITCRSKSDASVTATCTVTVKQYVENIAIQRTIASIAADETLQLNATVLPANATDKGLNWTSSNTGVATVDSTGKVHGVSGGSVTITATAKDGSGVKDSFKLVIVALPATAPQVPVTGVTGTASMTTYTVNGTAQASVTVSPSNADDAMVWASSVESVATVDNSGKITMVKGGNTILTARSVSDPHQYFNINLRVVQSVESITVTGAKQIDNIGGTTVLTAVVSPDNAEDKSVSWSSSNPAVATIDQNGKVTAVSNGVSYIVATARDGSGVPSGEKAFFIKVGKDPIPVETITLDLTEISRYTNEKDGVVITPTVLPEYADDLSVIWTSTDAQVASVDSNGRVTFRAPGTTTITCRSAMTSAVTATCTVTVKQYVEQIVIDGETYTMLPGGTTQLTATVYPSNASNKSLSWSSSDTAVATVSQSGLVTAVSPGFVTIKATALDGSGAERDYSIEVEKELQLKVSVVNDTVFTQGSENCDIAYVSLTNSSLKRMAEAGNELQWSMTRKSGSGDTELSVLSTTLAMNGTSYQSSVALLSGSAFPSAGTEVYTVTCKAGQFEESVDITLTVDGGDYATGVKLQDAAVGANTFTTQMDTDIALPAAPFATDGKALPANMSLSIQGDNYYLAHAYEAIRNSGTSVSFDESGVYNATLVYRKGNLSYKVEASFNVADENGIVHLRVEDVALSESFVTLVEGKSAQLTATVAPNDAYDSTVSWESSDPTVATVTKNGLVKGLKPGTALITCTANDESGKSAICAVNVESYLQLDEDALAFEVYSGGDQHADLEVVNVTLSSQERLVEDELNVTWTIERISGNSTELGIRDYVSNREEGLAVSGELLKLLRVNGAGTDEYRLTCAAGDYTDSCTILVTVKEGALPASVSLNTAAYAGRIDEWLTADLSYTVQPSGSALPEDVNVSIEGGNAFWNAISGFYSFAEPEKLIFDKPGSYTAYVVFSGTNYSYRCPVSLQIADEDGVVPATITDVNLSEEELLLTTGDSRTLSVSVEPANVNYSSVSWSSTNTAVATVSSAGKVTAIGPGYATIVASIPESDYEGTCLVYVEEGINFRESELERVIFVDGTTRMTLDSVMLTDNSSSRLSAAPEWTLRRVSGISLTLRAEPFESQNTQGMTLYGCNLMLYSVSKEGDTVYELTCSSGTESRTATIVVHAVNRERLLPASIALNETVFTADIGELIVVKPVVTAYPAGSKLPNGIVVSCEGSTQYQLALNAEDTFVSQSLSTFSFSKAGTYQASLIYSYSNMKYIVPVTFRIRNANGEVPVQASRMTLSEKALYLTKGDTAKLEAVFTPVNASNQSVTWSSSNPAVVTVDVKGNVTAIANGMATITCTPADIECDPISCAVTVEDYLSVSNGTTSRTLYLQGDQANSVGYAKLSEGTLRRLKADGLTPVWTIETDGVTHSELFFDTEEDGSSVNVDTLRLLSGGADSFTIRCEAGGQTWSQDYALTVVDLGATAPKSVTIRNTTVSAAVNQAVTIDFTPVISPAGASMPSGMRSTGFVGIGSFYDALDRNVYAVDGDNVTVAFTKPGQYLLTRRFLLNNLQYVTACTIVVGGVENGRGVLAATETAFTVYSGGQSGSVSTVSITDAILYQLWAKELTWSAERISGDSLTVALKENGDSVDVFVANVLKNGSDVWRISCSFGGMTEYVDITLTADDPRGTLPESITLANDSYTGMIGNVITVPLGVICSPSGSMLPDQGDAFWSFSFDRAGEERSNHTIENGMLTVDFTMSGYYTGTLRYQSGNVRYTIPLYFVIQDEELEVRKPNLNLYAIDVFDTVYPEGDMGVSIGHLVMAEGLSAYSTGNAVAFMKDANAVWKVTQTGNAATLRLQKVSDNAYDLILSSATRSGDLSYTVSCTVDGHTYSVTKALHVAGGAEPRPSATLKRTTYQTTVGELVAIDNRMYSSDDGSILQSSTTLDTSNLLAAVGYEIEEQSNDWSMTFYVEGTYNASVSAHVSNLTVETGIVIVVNKKGTETALTVLKFPAGLTAIEEEAFERITANVVDLRGTKIKTIGAGAFRNSVDIMEVYVPNSVNSIADDAFYGCLNAVFYCSAGSYAASWAAAHGIPVVNP